MTYDNEEELLSTELIRDIEQELLPSEVDRYMELPLLWIENFISDFNINKTFIRLLYLFLLFSLSNQPRADKENLYGEDTLQDDA